MDIADQIADLNGDLVSLFLALWKGARPAAEPESL